MSGVVNLRTARKEKLRAAAATTAAANRATFGQTKAQRQAAAADAARREAVLDGAKRDV
ncbi:DUF4169 family protein [Sphingomonas sp. 28-63-12]|uniref:DUF4169 family protein n=1 Tax=Sphingomonas sp. 28-63-12 TaxID=1970434 RepID=UPI000BCAEE44|nr:MAG: DUF4169 domain-containing protein [Sphingomonas sp. 28-63-12]